MYKRLSEGLKMALKWIICISMAIYARTWVRFPYSVLCAWYKVSVKHTLNLIFIAQKGIKCAIFVKKVEKIGPK